MDDRSFYFLEVMAALGAVGILAFLIFLVARYAKGNEPPASAAASTGGFQPHWLAFLLAAAALILIVGLITWQFFAEGQGNVVDGDWRSANRAIIFTVVMLAGGGGGLIVFLVYVFSRGLQQQTAPSPFDFTSTVANGANGANGSNDSALASAGAAADRPGDAEAETGPEAANIPTPNALRLLGLLGLALAILLLNWIYLDAGQQYKLMVTLIYPAGFVMAMVLVFDKVTRAWSPKPAAEVFREWLFCNGLIVLLILGYLNLLGLAEPKKYNALFWDMVHVFAFLLIFWLLDRRLTRYRFLVVLGYLVLLPILYLLWRFFQDLPVVEGIAFWNSLWPFFILAGIFFVLEIIALIATRGTPHQILPALKDALFVVIYFILLIVAIPAAPA